MTEASTCGGNTPDTEAFPHFLYTIETKTHKQKLEDDLA